VDLSVRGAWGYAFAGTLDALMFWVEMALFIMPLVVLASAKNRTNIRWIFVSAISLLLAGSIYRINTYLVGYHPAEGWHYFPSVSEIMVTVGIFSLEVVLYLIFVKTLPVLHKAHA
jgi:Ni/Fe-hydrogenase subunit HybB-like protein